MSSRQTRHKEEAAQERLSVLAHDMRHSLHALRVGLELLKTGRSGNQPTELCDALLKEQHSAAELLEELLTVLREHREKS